ncbi:MAG: bifunctional diguanylate cyclase/phosphodiesterase, partial [Acidimicrobiales bacterium]
DDLKVINDALGHETGDQLLKMMGHDLAGLARADDFVGRMNGDEFIVIIHEAASEQVALLVADRISSVLSRPIDVGPKKLSRTVSIGVTVGRSGESTPDGLLSEADAAMYAAKAAGKNAVRFFDESLQAQVLQRFEQEMSLRHAIETEGEIVVHYQPEIDILTGELLGVEALVRWNHPERGILAAGAFIETAEACGLVVPLGRIVLKQATAQLAKWLKAHPELDLKMRINASPAQLVGPDFVTEVGYALYENSLAASRICIEVTEHVVMDHKGQGMEILHRLRTLGVELAIDDFGTGYSSMSQLKRLPVDTLKIDRAFVTDLPTDVHDQAIVDAMIRLAEAFQLDVVAEGVETEEHVLELAKRGCRRVQGYLLARPMAADAIEELLGKPFMAGRLNLAAGEALTGLPSPIGD